MRAILNFIRRLFARTPPVTQLAAPAQTRESLERKLQDYERQLEDLAAYRRIAKPDDQRYIAVRIRTVRRVIVALERQLYAA